MRATHHDFYFVPSTLFRQTNTKQNASKYDGNVEMHNQILPRDRHSSRSEGLRKRGLDAGHRGNMRGEKREQRRRSASWHMVAAMSKFTHYRTIIVDLRILTVINHMEVWLVEEKREKREYYYY